MRFWIPGARLHTLSELVLLLLVSQMENSRPLRIFHIDDSEDDALVLTRVLRQCPHPIDLKWFPSAPEAMEYLERAAENELPDLILCDLRMPAMTGHEFIRWLRQSRFKSVTIIVLSSSDLMEDIREAYALGANSFLIKPLASSEILTMMNSAVDYWRKCQQAEQGAAI